MSTPEHREVARLLLQKAREDLSAAQVLVAIEDQAHDLGYLAEGLEAATAAIGLAEMLASD